MLCRAMKAAGARFRTQMPRILLPILCLYSVSNESIVYACLPKPTLCTKNMAYTSLQMMHTPYLSSRSGYQDHADVPKNLTIEKMFCEIHLSDSAYHRSWPSL